jgi:hypothetical protein
MEAGFFPALPLLRREKGDGDWSCGVVINGTLPPTWDLLQPSLLQTPKPQSSPVCSMGWPMP